MKEYLVTVKDPADFDQLHAELIEDRTRGHFLAKKLNGEVVSIPYLPDRPVELINYRPGSLRTAHYNLTDDEALELANDPRVLSVQLHIRHMDNVKVGAFEQQHSLFDKSYNVNNMFKNWALKSCTSATDPFSTKTQLDSVYPYTLSGKNVDIVIVDSGVTSGHPEFAVNEDGTGGSRVQQLDWYLATGLPGTMPEGHDTDEDGHGTHVAGIAAGNTCGWARHANIYSIKAITDWGIPAIDIYDVFDLIRVWHTNKPVNPATGKKNPTIVNCSWGFYTITYGAVTQFNYRGNSYTSTNFNSTQRAAYGLVNNNPVTGTNLHGFRVPSIDAEIQDCLDAGVIVVGAAGNYSHKVDVPGGVDYDNTYTDFYGATYYHRGATPTATPGVICVGNVDVTYPEQKSYSSECGPRVDVWAPGTHIMSAYNSGVADERNGEYFLAKLTGTSMASPQVVGALALILQMKPWLTHNQALALLNSIAVNNRVASPGAVSYTNRRSLQGAQNKFLFMPYTANGTGVTITSTLSTNFTI